MAKKYQLGLFHGRFQHIHLGHQKIIDQMLDECEQGVLLVGNCQAQRTARNPFTVLERLNLIKRVYGDRKDLIIGYFPDLPKAPETEEEYSQWGDWILEFAKFWTNRLPNVVYGGDETKLEWLYKNHLGKIELVKVRRKELLISATDLKELIRQNKEDEWKNSVDPKLHDQYQRLREIVSSSR